jgi:orotidine-5'-phosphate decarboxylase
VADNRLIVALDVHSMTDVHTLIERLGDSVSYYKVGMELFYRVGTEVLTYLHDQKKSIFLDLKLHDIPNTVAEGLCSLINLHADMLNVHASGGYEMMRISVERVHEKAAQDGIPTPKLIAVTILTSIGSDDWKEMGFSQEIRKQVIRFASLAKKAGMDGVVASPQEAAAIREACGPNFLIVTPGIRPAGADINDQSRIATPSAALRNGATHLVVGRPIRAAKDPKAAAEAIIR